MAKPKSDTKFTGLSFDASSVAPQGAFEPIPNNDYNVAITDGEIKPTTNGKMFEFQMTVLDGPFKGRVIFERLNIENSSEQAQEIALRQLSGICHATGVMRLKDVSELFNKPFVAKIGIEAAREDKETGQTYDARNKFKGAKFAKPEGGAAPAATPAAGPVPAWAAKKPGTPAAPAAKPAAPAAPKPPGKPAAPKPPVKKVDREFWVYMPDESTVEMTESEIVNNLAEGMPNDIKVCLKGTEEWKPLSFFGIPASEAGESAPAEEEATPAAPIAPPWAKKK